MTVNELMRELSKLTETEEVNGNSKVGIRYCGEDEAQEVYRLTINYPKNFLAGKLVVLEGKSYDS